MTIVSGPDHRNSTWANDSSNFGQKMLLKMGWSKGKGLGKNEQGTNDNLRAIRREEGLGIGAKTDLHGSEGFSTTSRNFHGVLATLQQEHGNDSSSSNSISKKSKKKRKKSSKGEKKDSGSLTLSSKRVTAGHSAKMRDAKDLSKKSKEDMAAIFGMKVDDYAQKSVWGRLSTLTSSNDASDAEEINKMEPKSDSDSYVKKKRKKKDKKKRKRSSEEKESADDDEVKEKRKKKKSKKA